LWQRVSAHEFFLSDEILHAFLVSRADTAVRRYPDIWGRNLTSGLRSTPTLLRHSIPLIGVRRESPALPDSQCRESCGVTPSVIHFTPLQKKRTASKGPVRLFLTLLPVS
jgi:hypothetical protein